jgi:hypothetical protein
MSGDTVMTAARKPPRSGRPASAQVRAVELREHPDGVTRDTLINPAESPLAWLYRRKGPDGKPLISRAQFRAGECLRADHARSGLSPRVTLDWSAAPSGRGRKSGGRGPADMLDSALDARARLERALLAVGPDFASLLDDVCCQLIGLEEAERMRGWPRRSGKVALDLALRQLARHYGFGEHVVGGKSSTRHWGAEGYRPTMEEPDRT